MSYTFGAATSNMISYTANGTSLFATSRTALITMWVYPTTLTATRCLFGAGAIWRLAIDTTTSSLRFTSDNTTDGVYTFPAGLALNTWTFVALLVNQGASTPVASVDAWTATADGPLVKRTVTTVTAPVGAQVTSNLVFGVGNITTTTNLSFQGNIENVAAIAENSGTVRGILGILANGATAAADAERIADLFITPLWRGDVSRIVWAGSQAIYNPSAGTAYAGLQLIAPLNEHVWTVKPGSNQGVIEGTNSGAVVSTVIRCPRPFKMNNADRFHNHHTRTPQRVA